MSKIRDIIQINSGYTSYVDLVNEYYSLEKNRVRMERYQPITAHRLAFEKIAGSLNPKDRRFYFLSGSYGTGKSHLLLMLANYFASPSDLPEMTAFFQNYETAQKQVLLKPGEILKERAASSLKASRKSGRFLVAICRFDLNLEFEGAVLRAIEEALQKEEADFELDSHYQEALRRIKDWEKQKSDKRFFTDLGAALAKQHSGWTINDLKDGLKKRDEDALKVFKACFAVVTDTDFTFKKDNLQDILKDILTNPTFKKKFKGLVILYYEFGYALDDGLVNLSRLHNFAQFCANSGLEHLPLIFIGTGHKAFRNHGQVGDAVHYSTLEARVTEIPLQTQGMEDIIAAIVQPKKEEDAWVKQVVPQAGTFTFLSGECKRLGLFNWLPAPKVKNNIIENIYPMHPLAIYALLRLALEAGSDNRSVFKFFSPEFETGEEGWKNVQEYSYPWFIEHNDILRDKRLVLYTADILVDYFKDGLSIDNRKLVDRIKTAVVNYEATLRELNTYIARQDEGKLFEETGASLNTIASSAATSASYFCEIEKNWFPDGKNITQTYKIIDETNDHIEIIKSELIKEFPDIVDDFDAFLKKFRSLPPSETQYQDLIGLRSTFFFKMIFDFAKQNYGVEKPREKAIAVFIFGSSPIIPAAEPLIKECLSIYRELSNQDSSGNSVKLGKVSATYIETMFRRLVANIAAILQLRSGNFKP